MNLPSPQTLIPSLEDLTAPGTYRVTVKGLVQGVGFRPFVYQLAHALGLKGWVMNTGQGVLIEILADDAKAMSEFLSRLKQNAPAGSRYDAISCEKTSPGIHHTFEIRESKATAINTDMPVDMAPCEHCLAELRDPTSRLYNYPFISCVCCGPRYTITASLPFDRDQTAMADFPLCRTCGEE